ncbi:hypothetical protein AGMMS50284_5630 [Clostridia bacterium]|nr:hypothetical protein AGMMS50284_5630 [Clostridia bacterium]
MKKIILLTVLIVFVIVFTGCSRTPTPKLNSNQQALADMFFANKDKWEEYDGLYCTDFQMFSSDKGGVIIHCGYSSSPLAHTEKAMSSHTVLKAFSYTCAKDNFTKGQEASFFTSGELIQKDVWGKTCLALSVLVLTIWVMMKRQREKK